MLHSLRSNTTTNFRPAARAYSHTFNGMMKNAKSYLLRGTEDGPKLLRKGVVGDWKNYFTPEQSERFDKELLAKLDGTGLEFEM